MDDPAVSDEASLPTITSVAPPIESGVSRDDRISWSFMRLLTPTIALTIDSGWIHRNWLSGSSAGFDKTIVGIKAEVYRSNEHEALIAATLGWGIGNSGAQGVSARAPDTIQPGIFFGKGFGDLPDRFAWLRPFAVTGAFSAEFPTRTTAANLGFDPLSGQLASMPISQIEILHWGISVQYSTLYLIKPFTPGGVPKSEPLYQFVPLVELVVDSPRGQKSRATMNPGVAYVADTWQVAIEAIVPLNHETGRAVGARAQLLLFLDDLAPTVFGKPLLSH